MGAMSPWISRGPPRPGPGGVTGGQLGVTVVTSESVGAPQQLARLDSDRSHWQLDAFGLRSGGVAINLNPHSAATGVSYCGPRAAPPLPLNQDGGCWRGPGPRRSRYACPASAPASDGGGRRGGPPPGSLVIKCVSEGVIFILCFLPLLAPSFPIPFPFPCFFPVTFLSL